MKINMRPSADQIGITAIKLRRLKEENLNDREFYKKSKIILSELVSIKTNSQKDYIKRLEEEVEKYRTLKRLLK